MKRLACIFDVMGPLFLVRAVTQMKQGRRPPRRLEAQTRTPLRRRARPGASVD